MPTAMGEERIAADTEAAPSELRLKLEGLDRPIIRCIQPLHSLHRPWFHKLMAKTKSQKNRDGLGRFAA